MRGTIVVVRFNEPEKDYTGGIQNITFVLTSWVAISEEICNVVVGGERGERDDKREEKVRRSTADITHYYLLHTYSTEQSPS